jgi:type I restriction enzyme S subunit
MNSKAGRMHLLQSANTTSGLNTISSSDVRSIPIMVPPLKVQAQFVAKVGHVEQLRATQQASLGALDDLFASLQDRAFRGEL